MVHKRNKQRGSNSQSPKTRDNPHSSHDGASNRKRARVIVRNLPFAGLSDDLVTSIFSKFGDIKELNLLKRDNGKFVGCAFVEFENRHSATNAIAKANGQIVAGRPIIVDWALPKNTFQQKVQELNDEAINVKKEENEEEALDSDEVVEFSIDTKPEGSFKNDESKMEESDDESMEDEDESSEELESSDHEDNERKPKSKPFKRSNDTEDGFTIFVRNIPFSATNEDLKTSFEKYGEIAYALICIDKLTEHSKGTGFVKFKTTEAADSCIRDNGNILVNDAVVSVTQAVSKDKLEDVKEKKKLKAKDTRNLYLVREGVVMSGSPAAATVSPSDMAKRLEIEQWKTQILRNLNMFVSRTRLAVHNLPPHYTDADLRQLFSKYSPPSATIVESRIMFDKKKVGPKGEPLSKEIGFVSFSNHEDALHALREINNNPKIFGISRRPIVAFSIENRQILNLKQKRLERSKAKQIGDLKTSADKLNRKQRRFIKRREMLIEKRQLAKKMKKDSASVEKSKSVEAIQAGNKKKKKKKPAQQSKAQPTISESNPDKLPNQKKRDTTAFGGVLAEPGKKMHFRSQVKLQKQVDTHKKLVKERKKVKKKQKSLQKTLKKSSQVEGTEKKKKRVDMDNDHLSKLISSYKTKIENAASFKKWYDS